MWSWNILSPKNQILDPISDSRADSQILRQSGWPTWFRLCGK
jgi:hypothetical protein